MDASGALYRQIVETLLDGIWIFDDAGRTTFFNARTAELLGRSPEEMAGLSVVDVLDEPGQAQFAAHLDELRAGHQNAEEVECSYLRKDGSRVWVMLSESTLFDDRGNVTGYVHRLTDYTERRELVGELRHSKEQLAEAQAIAKTGSWALDLVQDIVTFSDELRRMLEFEADAELPTVEGFYELMFEADQANVREAVRQGREETGQFEYDARVRRQGGVFSWVRVRGIFTYDQDGVTPIRIGGTAQDITDVKEVELQLLDAVVLNVLMQAMATAANESETLAEALAVTRQELLGHDDWSRAVGLRQSVNEAGEEILVPMIVGTDSVESVPFSLEPTVLERELAWRALRQKDIVFEEAAQPQTPSIAFPILAGDGVAAVIVITARTPFERQAMLRSMAEQVSGQLSRVAERERTAVELAAARDAAMEASRLKSHFLATMSHEIRTPMNGVIGLNDLLLRTELDNHQRRLAEGVQGAGRALLAVINDVLDFSKIEAGKLQLESVDFEVRTVFDQVAALLAESAHDKGIELVVGVRPEVPEWLKGDPTRLSQILSNLVSNAVKFTIAGEVLIRCSADAEENGDVVLRVEVSDTGIGIDARSQDELFEPFSQADASTTRTHGGTGLGLAISRQLVAAIGGEIGVDSEPGVGSTFWFTGSFQITHSRPTPAGTIDRAHLLHARRALVVDDNASNRLIIAELLTDWELDVEQAAAADEALEMVRAASQRGAAFDLVLLDLVMPDRDGIELASMITSMTPEPWPKLLLLSSAEDIDPTKLEAAGISVNLTKPVGRSALFDGLMDCVAETHGIEELTPAASQPVSPDHGRHLLVVEDNEVNQLVALGILEVLGYTADVADDGVVGVEMSSAGRYDAILMDVQMPRMDGYAATRAIRAREGAGSRVPIIAMTASAVEGEREKCISVGMDDFLTKPLEPERLESKLHEWVKSASDEAVAVLDFDRLSMLASMGPGATGLIERAVNNFIDHASEALQSIRSAVDEQDADMVRMSSHQLKGSALNLGVSVVGQLCLEIELLGDSGELTGVGPLLHDLKDALDEATGALREYQRALNRR